MKTTTKKPKGLGLGLGLGAKSTQWLKEVGVETPAQLNALGAVRCFAMVAKIYPQTSLNLLWALEGAINQKPWQTIAREERTRLLMMLEDETKSASNNQSRAD